MNCSFHCGGNSVLTVGVAGVDVGTGIDRIALGSRELNLLVIAAGLQEVDKLETVSKQSIQRQLEINAIGPLFAVKELHPKLVKGARVS